MRSQTDILSSHLSGQSNCIIIHRAVKACTLSAQVYRTWGKKNAILQTIDTHSNHKHPAEPNVCKIPEWMLMRNCKIVNLEKCEFGYLRDLLFGKSRFTTRSLFFWLQN